MKFSLITLVGYSIIALIVFGGLTQTFFQQDEWAIAGNFLYWQKAHLGWFTRLFVYEQDTHMIPLGVLFSYVQYVMFGLSFAPYALASLALHVVNAFLVFKFADELFRSKAISFLAGLFFLVNATTHQAVTWTATSAGTLGSTFFALLSLIFFQRGKIIPSLLLLLASLGFKETSIFLFAFYPIFWLLTNKNPTFKSFARLLILLLVFGLLYVGARVVISQFWTTTASTAAELSQPGVATYLYRLFSNPVRIFTQTIVPVPILLKIARHIMLLGYPQFVYDGTPDPYVAESVASDIVSFAFAAVAATILLVFNKDRRFLVLSILFIALSAIPFLIIPGRAGYISLFDGRHLYLTSVFVSILLSLVITRIYQVFSKRWLSIGVFSLLVIGFVSMHVVKIRRDIEYQVAVAQLRQSILRTITEAYPVLPQETVFYIESDKAYYGLPPEETIVPFQSGFGQTLLVWYNGHGDKFPACFFERKFLYVLTSQDYKECEGRGFGFVRSLNKLREFVQTSRISPEFVMSFRFNSSTNVLTDITGDIQRQLKQQ